MDKDKISCIKTWANAKKQKYNTNTKIPTNSCRFLTHKVLYTSFSTI